MKMRTKIITIMFVVFSSVMIFIGAILVYVSSNTVKDQIYSYLHSSSRARAEHIRTYLKDEKEAAKLLAAASVYRDFLLNPSSPVIKDKIDKRLERTMSIDPHTFEVFILDKKGIVVASSDKSSEGSDKSNDLYFTEAQKDTYIKDVYYSESIDKITYSVSSPIFNDDNSLLGVSVIRYDPSGFYGVVYDENGLGATEENFLVDKDSYFISPSLFLGESAILKQKVETPNTQQCFSSDEINYVSKYGYSGLKEYLGNKVIFENKDYRGVDVIAAHEYIPETGWCLVTKVDASQLLISLSQLTTTIIYIFTGTIITWLLLMVIILNRMTKPMIKLNDLVKVAIAGNYNMKSNNKSKDEIGVLSRNFNLLMQTIINTRSDIEKQVKDQTTDIIKKDQELQSRQLAVLNILDDVKQEKKKAEILADDLKKFKMAVEGTTEQIVITDPEGIIIFANDSTERLTGFSVAEIIGKKVGTKDLWGGQMSYDLYKKFWKTIKFDKKPFAGVFTNKRKNGVIYEVANTVTPIMDASGEVVYFVGIERDITKEKEIDRAKTEFVSLASHQLRTPLSAINWYAEMLLNGDAGKINDDQKTYLDEIYKGNQRMVELVNALLNVSRLDLGTFEINPKPVILRDVIDDVVEEMKHTLEVKKQTIAIRCPANLPELSADPKLMRIIIQNLISNAIKYTPENGKISVSAEYNAEHPKITYVIKVADNGYGVPNSQKDKIFTKLFRADNVRAMDTEGTGLGLYIVKSILNESGGHITFDSIEGKGTIFTVTLPKTGMKQKGGTKGIM